MNHRVPAVGVLALLAVCACSPGSKLEGRTWKLQESTIPDVSGGAVFDSRGRLVIGGFTNGITYRFDPKDHSLRQVGSWPFPGSGIVGGPSGKVFARLKNNGNNGEIFEFVDDAWVARGATPGSFMPVFARNDIWFEDVLDADTNEWVVYRRTPTADWTETKRFAQRDEPLIAVDSAGVAIAQLESAGALTGFGALSDSGDSVAPLLDCTGAGSGPYCTSPRHWRRTSGGDLLFDSHDLSQVTRLYKLTAGSTTPVVVTDFPRESEGETFDFTNSLAWDPDGNAWVARSTNHGEEPTLFFYDAQGNAWTRLPKTPGPGYILLVGPDRTVYAIGSEPPSPAAPTGRTKLYLFE